MTKKSTKSQVNRYAKRLDNPHRYSKKNAWDMFSVFIRLRDCLKTTGTTENGRCFTCGRIYPFNRLHAGHFVPGRGGAVLFDEIGVRAQCEGCNIHRGGEQLLFRQNLVKERGEEYVQMLEAKRYKIKRHSKIEYDALYHYYKQEADKLLGIANV